METNGGYYVKMCIF